MAVEKKFKGKEVDKKKILAAENFALKNGIKCVYLEPMGDIGGFYEKLGYKYECVKSNSDSFQRLLINKKKLSI